MGRSIWITSAAQHTNLRLFPSWHIGGELQQISSGLLCEWVCVCDDSVGKTEEWAVILTLGFKGRVVVGRRKKSGGSPRSLVRSLFLSSGGVNAISSLLSRSFMFSRMPPSTSSKNPDQILSLLTDSSFHLRSVKINHAMQCAVGVRLCCGVLFGAEVQRISSGLLWGWVCICDDSWEKSMFQRQSIGSHLVHSLFLFSSGVGVIPSLLSLLVTRFLLNTFLHRIEDAQPDPASSDCCIILGGSVIVRSGGVSLSCWGEIGVFM